jgi:Fe-S-cluster containining protein
VTAQLQSISAGAFSVWLHETREALRTGSAADVPCGTCTACCTSSYFIHIHPDETETLRHIGKDGLTPAAGLPQGNMLMGYDQDGLCPQMNHGQCAIYEHRPRTCRSYDCRVFAAAGITAGDDKPRINSRVEEWSFDYPTQRDREEHEAVRAAARFIQKNAALFPGGKVPENPSQLAILAIKVYRVFLVQAPTTVPATIAQAVVEQSRLFGFGQEH